MAEKIHGFTVLLTQKASEAEAVLIQASLASIKGVLSAEPIKVSKPADEEQICINRYAELLWPKILEQITTTKVRATR